MNRMETLVRRAVPPAVVGLLLCAVLLVATAPGARAEQVQEVRISQFRFAPGEVAVPRGTTVRWVNDDDEPHTVTSDAGAFASPGLDRHEDFTFTFDAPGTYPYHCALHPTMKGRVVVR